jgi:hypothetical protein
MAVFCPASTRESVYKFVDLRISFPNINYVYCVSVS